MVVRVDKAMAAFRNDFWEKFSFVFVLSLTLPAIAVYLWWLPPFHPDISVALFPIFTFNMFGFTLCLLSGAWKFVVTIIAPNRNSQETKHPFPARWKSLVAYVLITTMSFGWYLISEGLV